MDNWPEIIRRRVRKEIADLSDMEFAAYQKGISAAHSAAVFAVGTFGSDVIFAVKRFEGDAAQIRQECGL